MMQALHNAVIDTDILLWIVDIYEKEIPSLVQQVLKKENIPVLLVINKIDLVTDQLELWEFYTMMVADAFRTSSIHTPLLSIATQFRGEGSGGGENSEAHIAKVITSRRLPSLGIRHYSSKLSFSITNNLILGVSITEVFFKYLFYFCFFTILMLNLMLLITIIVYVTY